MDKIQNSFFKINYKHRFSSGGVLRSKKLGRGQRPLSCKEPLHLVFKVKQSRLRLKSLRIHRSFLLIDRIVKKYAFKFYVQVEQISIQNDHIHLLIRTKRRSQYLAFFRVVAGQIAQVFQKEGLLSGALKNDLTESIKQRVTDTPLKLNGGTSLWKFRPFTRVIRGFRAYKIVRDYIQLNEKEILGEIKYNSLRLKDLSRWEKEKLWS